MNMRNVFLEYLLKDNPEETYSATGAKIRKAIHPLFKRIMMLFTTGKLTIVNTGTIPTDKPIIFAGTHGFHDDIIFTMKTANKHAYLLYGSLLDFFNSFHGLGLWVNGVILVDRKNKKSRKASIDKMIKVIKDNNNIVMFPEGTWNKNEAILVQKLYPGIYEVAKETGAMIVPIATVLYEKNAYAISGDAYDITKLEPEDSKIILQRQLNKLNKVKDLMIYNTEIEHHIFSKIDEFLKLISEEAINETTHEQRLEIIEKIATFSNKLLESIDNNAEEKNKIIESIITRAKKLLKASKNEKKMYSVEILRDKMCSLKWNLLQKSERKDLDSEYWQDFIKSQIESTHGLYDYSIEDIAEYKDETESSLEEVFAPIKKLQK